jgi:hypothetical protein
VGWGDERDRYGYGWGEGKLEWEVWGDEGFLTGRGWVWKGERKGERKGGEEGGGGRVFGRYWNENRSINEINQ